MSQTIISTFQFLFNKDETDPALRFPDIGARAYSFNIQIDQNFYQVRISYNYWANTPQVSVYNSSGTALVLNAPLIEKINDTWPSYLYGTPEFDGYYLMWDLSSQQFVFSKDDA